jgi:hypothetical protein
MTCSKRILALLVALVALVALAPAASATSGTDRVRWNSVDSSKKKFLSATPNPRASAVDPNPVRYGSLELDRRHARGIGPKAAKIKAIGLHGSRFNG